MRPQITLVIVDGEPGDEAGMTVAEALGHGPTDDIVAVTGALFVDPDGTSRLCDAIAESFPPSAAASGSSSNLAAPDDGPDRLRVR